jgi:hypothetical protein
MIIPITIRQEPIKMDNQRFRASIMDKHDSGATRTPDSLPYIAPNKFYKCNSERQKDINQ